MTDISAHLSLGIQNMAATNNKEATLVLRERISGESTLVSLRADETVASLKAQLQDKLGASPEHLNLFVSGSKNKLNNNVSIGSLNTENFEFTYSLSGGGKKKDTAAEVAGNEDVQEACCELLAALLEG